MALDYEMIGRLAADAKRELAKAEETGQATVGSFGGDGIAAARKEAQYQARYLREIDVRMACMTLVVQNYMKFNGVIDAVNAADTLAQFVLDGKKTGCPGSHVPVEEATGE